MGADVPEAMFGTPRGTYYSNVRRDVLSCIPRVGGTLVDIGGGVGATALHLKNAGYVERAGVIDIVDLPTAPGLDFVYRGDVEDDQFLDNIAQREGPFRIVLCLDILEHLVDPWTLVARLHRHLTRDGVLIASIPNVRYYKASVPLLFCNRWTLTDTGVLDRTHLRFFVRETAVDLMTSSGLHMEALVASPDMRKSVTVLRSLTFGLLDSFTARQYVIRVRRID